MKNKVKISITMLTVICLITGCQKNEIDNIMQVSTETAKEIIDVIEGTSSHTENHTLADSYNLTYENFPVIDGSTSTIPLDAGLRAMLFDIPQSDAEILVSHTKTHTAFQKLINGECDMIFSVPLSDEQETMASNANFMPTLVPIALEGFVFVVNANNPVDSLTQEQIRGIYSGRITNWSEVGGNDAEIIAYQRNNDSGSQNHMTVFMGDTPLMPAKMELVALGMQGLMDSVAVNDNSENSIGYSVYSYAAQMYSEQGKVKFITVDGIPAKLETMADKTYPLLSTTYMMYNADIDKNSATGRFIEFIQSEDGIKAIENAGYIPY